MPAFGARSVVGHGRSSLEIAEEQKNISFSVHPARILFQIKKKIKKNLMVSFNYVRFAT